ncbi:hypothetical protein Tco_0008021 [Tanacetum coccineum]
MVVATPYDSCESPMSQVAPIMPVILANSYSVVPFLGVLQIGFRAKGVIPLEKPRRFGCGSYEEVVPTWAGTPTSTSYYVPDPRELPGTWISLCEDASSECLSHLDTSLIWDLIQTREHEYEKRLLKEMSPSKETDETEPFKENETAATPPPPRSPQTRIPFSQTRLRRARKTVRLEPPMPASIKACITEHAVAPIPPTIPTYNQAPLGHRAAMIRLRDDISEEDMPPQRRFVLTAPPPGCDIAESFAAAARASRGQYDFVDAVGTGQGLIRSPGHDVLTITRAADRAEDVGYVRALLTSEHRNDDSPLGNSMQASVTRQRICYNKTRANDAMTLESIHAMMPIGQSKKSTQDDRTTGAVKALLLVINGLKVWNQYFHISGCAIENQVKIGALYLLPLVPCWTLPPLTLEKSFDVELDRGKIVGFDVIIEMDWLTKYHGVIFCEREDCMTEYLSMGCDSLFGTLYTIGSQERVKGRSGLETCQLLETFPKVFPGDLPGIPLARQVKFQIDLVPGAAPVARAPYRFGSSHNEGNWRNTSKNIWKKVYKTNSSPWGAPVLFVKKKDGSFRDERSKPLRVRALVMTIGLNLPKQILEAQTEALKPENLTAEDVGVRSKTSGLTGPPEVMLKVSPWKGVVRFGKRGKLNPRYVGPFKKCLSDESLVIPLEELRVDDKLHFVEEPIEVMDRKIKQLKRSRIPIIKVMDAPTLPVYVENNLEDPIDIKVDTVHPAPVDVFPAATVVRTLAQHGEAIRGIHGHLQGVPINEEMSVLRFRMGMSEEENASLRGRIKTMEATNTITRRQEKRARMELERQLASIQESQRQDQENFKKLQEFVTSQLGRHS